MLTLRTAPDTHCICFPRKDSNHCLGFEFIATVSVKNHVWTDFYTNLVKMLLLLLCPFHN